MTTTQAATLVLFASQLASTRFNVSSVGGKQFLRLFACPFIVVHQSFRSVRYSHHALLSHRLPAYLPTCLLGFFCLSKRWRTP